MRKVSRLLVVTVIVPFLVSCMATLQQPLPEPAARPDTGIRGLILGSAESAERIEYREMQFVEWTDSTVAIIGIVRGEGQNITTRTYRLSDVEAILVHQLHRTGRLSSWLEFSSGLVPWQPSSSPEKQPTRPFSG